MHKGFILWINCIWMKKGFHFILPLQNPFLLDIVEAELANFAEKTPAQSNTFNINKG